MFFWAPVFSHPKAVTTVKSSLDQPLKVCTLFKVNKKKTLERPHLHEDIKKHWRCSGVSIVNLKIPQLLLVFHSWISGTVASWVYQQRSKNWQVKIMKHARTDANYAILTKRVKLQHEKKPVSNLKCMHSVAFEQTFMKFIEIFVLQEFLYRKKNRSGNHLSDHHW